LDLPISFRNYLMKLLNLNLVSVLPREGQIKKFKVHNDEPLSN
jgi:hypothetical protein